MQYHSTNLQSPKVSLRDAIMHSGAPDGGLYMPDEIPLLPQAIYNNISEMTQLDISYLVANSLFGTDIPAQEIKNICEAAINFKMPLVEIEPGIYALELFHGPTMTVKDIGARYLARMLSAMRKTTDKPLNVMVATTGNSGCAIANGFHNVPGVNVFALYPKNTPAHLVAQISILGGNVYAIGINGTINECRDIVQSAINDRNLNEQIHFTCANSSNIGRLLPYVIPYFLAYSQLLSVTKPSGKISVSVPCGNCGILAAGLIAKRMGLPLTNLIAACNQNGSFNNYINQEKQPANSRSLRTLSYAMDSCFPANAPRFDELSKGDKNRLSSEIISEIITDKEIAQTIKDVYRRTGYLLDQHSAAAYRSLSLQKASTDIGILFASAHPARSASIISEIIDEKIQLPAQLKRFVNVKGKEFSIAPTYPAFRKFILNTLNVSK